MTTAGCCEKPGAERTKPSTFPALDRLERAERVAEHAQLVERRPPGRVVGLLDGDVAAHVADDAARRTALYQLRMLRDTLGSLEAAEHLHPALDRLERAKRVAEHAQLVERWVKVLGFVRSAPGFSQQPAVVNGFSDLVIDVYGEERGLCARSAIGVAELPDGIAVEVEAVVALR